MQAVRPRTGRGGKRSATSIDVPTFFDCCRAGVNELLDANVEMDVVERAIDTYALDSEEKDALWLWASGRRDCRVGRADALLVGW
jgi:hypothetical protein